MYLARILAIRELLDDLSTFQTILEEELISSSSVEDKDDSDVMVDKLLMEDNEEDEEDLELFELLLTEDTDSKDIVEDELFELVLRTVLADDGEFRLEVLSELLEDRS